MQILGIDKKKISGTRLFHGNTKVSSGWGYYHVSIAMHDTNAVQENPTSVMYEFNTFFYRVPHFLMALRIP